MPLTKCPICDGEGEVAVTDYDSTIITFIRCEYCKGTGLVELITLTVEGDDE